MPPAPPQLPPALAERPRDPSYDAPVPFACGDERLGDPLKKRVLQCAHSPLTWGTALVVSPGEAEAGSFHFPPLHLGCAELALTLYPALAVPVLGQDEPLTRWALVVTGVFELVRPASRQGDMRVSFTPSSVTESRLVDTDLT